MFLPRLGVRFFLLLLLTSLPSAAQTLPEVAQKQVVLKTSRGDLVMELFPGKAPHHVAAFLQRIQDKFYQGTIFHRIVPMGIIQGGDPLSKDPGARDRYGTGGLMELEAEFNDVSHLRGTVSAVLVPGEPNSAGSQFFICVTDQPQLDGHYTAFGRVVEGLGVLEEISKVQADSQNHPFERIEILDTYLRERPPPEVAPFSDVPVEELAKYTVLIRTDLGDIELGFYPEVAPNHVRQFLRFAELGMYTGTPFHRIVPNFVIQGGMIHLRQPPISPEQQKYLKPLKAEFNNKKHVRGTLSMARAADPDSGMDSFFIVLEANPHLDGKYTVFGEVIRGIEVVDGISQLPTRGETPIIPFLIRSIQVRGPERPR